MSRYDFGQTQMQHRDMHCQLFATLPWGVRFIFISFLPLHNSQKGGGN